MQANKKKILLFTDWYLPGYKAGGPIQSCKNIVTTLSGEFEFFILTSDRDLGELNTYKGIETNVWVQQNNGSYIYYALPGHLKLNVLKKIITELSPDVVYFNSMFSLGYTLKPLLVLHSIKYKGKIVLAPRGMLHQGAIAQKPFKKKIFLAFFQNIGIIRKVFFHATDAQEKSDIIKYFKNVAKVEIVENIPNIDDDLQIREKRKNHLRMVFISRIHPKKKLDYILKVLSTISTNGNIVFDVYGTNDDNQYLNDCISLSKSLPSHTKVQFFDPIPHHDIFNTLHKYHLFVLSTLGENFGHAIFEALSSGCPVLISDQTPWVNLEQCNAGWDIPLQNSAKYKLVLEELILMEDEHYQKLSNGATTFAKSFINNASLKEKYLALFS